MVNHKNKKAKKKRITESQLNISTHNNYREIDPAFLRRFERKMMFGMPDSVTRKCLIEQFLQPFKKWNIQKQNELTALTEGFSGDDIRIACKEVSMKMIRDAINLGIKSG